MEDVHAVIWLLGKGRRIQTSLSHPTPGLAQLVSREEWAGQGETAQCYVYPSPGAVVVIDYTAAEESPEEALFRRLVEEGHSSPVEWAAIVAPTARLRANACRAIVRRGDRAAFLRWTRRVIGKKALEAIRARQP
jgi:hypothetical protein